MTDIQPHICYSRVETLDYNGQGRWSAAEITSRYQQYAAEAGITPLDVSPVVSIDRKFRRVYPVMTKIIEGIKSNDPACIRIGIEFIEEDQSFTFGRGLKSDTARALRSAQLTKEQGQRILHRVFDMLERGYIPHEYRYYARLARTIDYKKKRLTPDQPEAAVRGKAVQVFRTQIINLTSTDTYDRIHCHPRRRCQAN